MSCEVKFIEVDSASFQANWLEVGDALLELPVGLGARERSFGSGWARGVQLSVYMVRSGIS
jgi:hypothetical protein